MRIGLDIDGVLAQFDSGFAQLLSAQTGRTFPLEEPTFPAVWSWPEYYGCTEEEVQRAWTYVERNPGWWMALQPYAENLEAARQLPGEITFLTARKFPGARTTTVSWLLVHGWEHPTVLTHCADKALIARGLGLDVLIDDHPGTVLDICEIEGCVPWLVLRPYNSHAAAWVRNMGGRASETLNENL